MTKVEKADFHGHPLLRPSYAKSFGLADYVTVSQERGITIPPITSFSDDKRFELFYEDNLPKDWTKEKFKDGFVVYEKEGRRTIFFRGHEVPTTEGHLLLIGGDRPSTSGRSLEDTISEAEQLGKGIVADHPLISSIRGGLGWDAVIKYQKRIHALESNSQAINLLGNCSFGIFKQQPNNERVYELAEKTGHPVLHNSDFHMSYIRGLPYLHGGIDDIGIATNTFPELTGEANTWFVQAWSYIQEKQFAYEQEHTKPLRLLRWQVPVMLSIIKDRLLRKQGKAN